MLTIAYILILIGYDQTVTVREYPNAPQCEYAKSAFRPEIRDSLCVPAD